MLSIEGGTIEQVTPVDPSGIAVSLVIDDSPTMTPEAVNDGQGAAVELVRNTGEGTQISLSTPSGLRTAPTTDRDANIARIAGIVAGAPDIVPMPKLVLDAANDLADTPVADRHLVIVLGTTLPDGPVLDRLREVALAAGIHVHVVASIGLEAGTIEALSDETGGSSPVAPATVGEMDEVTRVIADRYRVAATVDTPGAHAVTLAGGGRQFATTLEVRAPDQVAQRAVPPTTAAQPPATRAPGSAPGVTAASPPPATGQQSSGDASPATTVPTVPTATSAGTATDQPAAGTARTAVIAALVLALLAVGAWVAWVLRRRSGAGTAVRRRRPPRPRTETAEPETDQDPRPAQGSRKTTPMSRSSRHPTDGSPGSGRPSSVPDGGNAPRSCSGRW